MMSEKRELMAPISFVWLRVERRLMSVRTGRVKAAHRVRFNGISAIIEPAAKEEFMTIQGRLEKQGLYK